MDGGRQPCGLCKKSFASLSDWIPHYNSRHNDIYRSGVPGYFTCTRCLKFLVIEEEGTHHRRRTAPTLRSTATPGLSSLSTEGHPRGDPRMASEAGTHSPSGGGRRAAGASSGKFIR